MASDLELVDRQLLNILQSSFPLAEEPFEEIGRRLDIPGSDVMARIEDLKATNVVRQISAIFDTRRLGYKTVLVAMRLPEDRLDAGAQMINEHPGVSHNYARNGSFNLWFTLAVPPDESLENTIKEMAHRTGAESYRLMPTIRFFKIGVNFDMVDMVKEEGAATDYYRPDDHNSVDAASGTDGRNGADDFKRVEPVAPFEIEVIKELQEDVPLQPRPFDPMVVRLGISQGELFKERFCQPTIRYS